MEILSLATIVTAKVTFINHYVAMHVWGQEEQLVKSATVLEEFPKIDLSGCCASQKLFI